MELPGDDFLRRREVSEEMQYKYYEIGIRDVIHGKTSLSEYDFLKLIAISSVNTDDDLRERSVDMLAELNDDRVIRFLIYRLSDNVAPIQEKAAKALTRFLNARYLNILVDHLDLMEALCNSESLIVRHIAEDVMAFIFNENGLRVVDAYYDYRYELRPYLAKRLLANDVPEIAEAAWPVLTWWRGDNIWPILLQYSDKLTVAEIRRYLKVGDPTKRMKFLLDLQQRKDFHVIIAPHVTDRNHAIRRFAMDVLKTPVAEAVNLHYHNIQQDIRVVSAIRALRHFGIAHVDLFEKLLLHKRARVQVAAFIALKTFAPDRAVPWALANLDRQELKVRYVLVRFLATRPEPEVLPRARACYEATLSDIRKGYIRLSMVHLFSRMGGWRILADMLRASADETSFFRYRYIDRLRSWLEKASTYPAPSPQDLERARQIFPVARARDEREPTHRKDFWDNLHHYLYP
jgi:HEAT repeat protein